MRSSRWMPAGTRWAESSPAPTGSRLSPRSRRRWLTRPTRLKAILPPGATRALLAEYSYGTVGLRLAGGAAGIPAFEGRVADLARSIQHQQEARTHRPAIRPSFAIDRTDVVHGEVQQAIRPESIALIIFAVFGAVAMIVLAGRAWPR